MKHLLAATGTLLLCLACTVLPASGPATALADDAAPLDVRLLVNSAERLEGSYEYRLLDLALSCQERPYTLSAEAVEASQLRRVETVRSSLGKDYVIILGSSPENERLLRAVYVPVHLGLDVRQRILLTRRGLEPELARVRTLDDLKGFVFGQGLGWSDVDILKNAGLKVFTASSKPNLMHMLARGRIDLFPRGLFEVIEEFEENREAFPDVVIDEHLVLTYPIASFFFVNPDNPDLYVALKQGMEKAYASGRMQDLLMADTEHREALMRIRVEKRRTIAIPFPHATEATLAALKRFVLAPGKKPGAPMP